MAAPDNTFAFDFDATTQAAEHWLERQPTREQKIEQLKQKHYVGAEPRERLAKRANRLIDKVKETFQEEVLSPAQTALSDGLRELIGRGPIQADEVNDELMERVIGETRDFLSVNFLAKAIQASRCVGRIVTNLGRGRVGYGTGFMVSPRLLLTNHHVLPSEREAATSLVEFNYQLDISGKTLATQRFTLEPDVFFLNDKTLDYALVAVRETSDQGEPLGEFGWLPLIKEEGKIILKDCVNIIQHPRGELKQVVIRENELVDLLDSGFAHYRGDTEPGSSGSPAFNDQWEVIALHHSGVPKTNHRGQYLDVDGNVWKKGDDPARLAWLANEGVRISRIVQHVENAPLRPHERPLREQLLKRLTPNLNPEGVPNGVPNGVPSHQRKGDSGSKAEADGPVIDLLTDGADGTVITVPLNVTIRLGKTPTVLAVTGPPAEDGAPAEEAIKPDPDYTNRPGYDPDFLGFYVPMPKLSNAIRRQALVVPDTSGSSPHELKYYHYSVIMNASRRLAFVSAVNLWANAPFDQQRDGKDRWFVDPRIPASAQTNEDLYRSNPLDRGHLTRRDDAAWGHTQQEAKLANDDTFHFTNCSPQHEIFNQSGKASAKGLRLWGNLENHISEQALANDRRITVFNGPIFRSDDRKHRGVQLPREFWKVVVFEKDGGEPTALAFLLSQASLIKDLPTEEFVVGEYQPFQIKVRELEGKTKLDFGPLRTFDPLENEANEGFFEVDTEAVPLQQLSDIVI